MRGIKIPFRGEEYFIPASKAFELGERVEDIVTLTELGSWGARPKFFKLARCFGEMLRFAGCKVSDTDVHADMMGQIKALGAGGETSAKSIIAAQAIGALIAILMDGAPDDDEEAAPGKEQTAS